MKNLVNKLYHNRLAESVLHTVIFELKKDLVGCSSVLDLGCGPDSPLQQCKAITYKMGVEAYAPYLSKAKKNHTHNDFSDMKIESLVLDPKSFDAVAMVEVLEHLTKKEGLRILKKAERWARKKVIVTTPNGFINQKSLDKNILQKHLSGWVPKEFIERGYKVRGLAGLKILRKEAEHNTMDDSIMSTIRWQPKAFWFLVAVVSQVFTYYLPNLAFEFIAVKDVEHAKR